MFCKYCGKENENGKNFCKYCGKPLANVSEPVHKAEPIHKAEPVHKESHKKRKAGSKSSNTGKLLAVMFSLLAVLLIVLGVFLFLFLKNGSTEDSEEIYAPAEPDEDYDADDAFASDENNAEMTDTVPGDDMNSAEDIILQNEPAEVESENENENGQPAYQEVSEEKPSLKNTDIHTYEVKSEDITWTQAYEKCRQMGGYLARIDSDEEFGVICDMLNKAGITGVAYIGGRKGDNGRGYYWVGNDGELYDYDVSVGEYAGYWLPGEPSYSDEVDGEVIEESYLSILYKKSENRWYWNDIADDVRSLAPDYYTGKIAYICEYE